MLDINFQMEMYEKSAVNLLPLSLNAPQMYKNMS